jgi:four helix bundle protein
MSWLRAAPCTLQFEISNLKFEMENKHALIFNPFIRMTYQSFEELPVWQEAARLYESAEDLLKDEFPSSRAFRDQLDRAALSVSNNIAEGFERGTTNELISFLYIARGSAGEVRSMLKLKLRRLAEGPLRRKIETLVALAVSCSKQLRSWADSLQNSSIKGQRHLTQKSRAEHEQNKRAAAAKRKLLEMLPVNHPLRTDAAERGLL